MDKKAIAVYEVKGLIREVKSRFNDMSFDLSTDNIGRIDLSDIRALLDRIEERSKEFVDDVDENALY